MAWGNGRRTSVVFAFILIIGCLVAPQSEAPLAGDGKINPGTPHKVDIIVNLLYDDPQPEQWEALFNEASKLLYNATEKQMQLGTVELFVNCRDKEAAADIVVEDNENRGAIAALFGLGKKGQRVVLSRAHKSTSTKLGLHGVVHEFGHFIFALRDEHIGIQFPVSDAPAGTPTLSNPPSGGFIGFCTAPLGVGKASIMDSTRLKIAGALDRTEFCTNPADGFSTSHETGYIHTILNRYIINNHQEFHEEATWTTLRKHALSRYGIAMQEPTSEPQNDTGGHQSINFDLVEVCTLGSAPTIDRSGSMGGARIELAKQGATIFVDLTEIGEDLAITSFSSTARTDFSMRTVTDDSVRAAAKSAIASISARGSTNIGGGLRQALNEIRARTLRTENEIILLLSDGFHNTGENPLNVLPDIQGENVRVFTVGIGGADVSLLAQIAANTGGEFFFANAPGDLPGILAAIVSAARGDLLIDELAGDIEQGTEVAGSIPIDEFSDKATFLLTWGGSDLDLTLVAPDGTVVDPAFADQNPDVEFVSASNHEFYRIANPQSGDWQIKVNAVQTTGAIPFLVQVFGSSPVLHFGAHADKENYVFPEPIELYGAPSVGHPVIGVDVSGTVLRPDGTTVPIIFFDDGLPEHGDFDPDDGIYSNIFDDYSTDGTYTFDITARNETGMRVELDPPSDPPVDRSIAPFTRRARLAVNVTGVPEALEVPIDLKPEDATNAVNPNEQGVVPVAILTSPEFDATTVDPLSAEFGSGAASEVHGKGHIEDVDGDGDLDMLLHFNVQASGILCDDTSVSLVGSTLDGQDIQGSDSVSTIGCD